MSIILALGLSPLLISAGFSSCEHLYGGLCDDCALAKTSEIPLDPSLPETLKTSDALEKETLGADLEEGVLFVEEGLEVSSTDDTPPLQSKPVILGTSPAATQEPSQVDESNDSDVWFARFQLYNSSSSPYVMVSGPKNGTQLTPGSDVFAADYGAIVSMWTFRGGWSTPVAAGEPASWHNQNMVAYAYETLDDVVYLPKDPPVVMVRPDDLKIIYGGLESFTATVSGEEVSSEVLASIREVLDFERSDPDNKNAGTYIISIPKRTQTNIAAVFSDYEVIFETGVLTITALEIDLSKLTVTHAQKIFGDNDPDSYTIKGWPQGTDLSHLSIVVEKRPGVVIKEGKHTYVPSVEDVRFEPYVVTIAVSPVLSSVNNYTIVGGPLTATLSIVARPITVSASDLYVAFGDPRPEQSVLDACFGYGNFAFGQGEEVLDREPAQTDYASSWSKGTYKEALTAKTSEKNGKHNYSIPEGKSNIIVGAKTVDLSAVTLDIAKVYGNNDPSNKEYIDALFNWPVNIGTPGVDYALTFDRSGDPGELVNKGKPYEVKIAITSLNNNYTVGKQPDSAGLLTITKKPLVSYINAVDDIVFNTNLKSLSPDKDYGYRGFVKNATLGIDDSFKYLVNSGQLTSGVLSTDYVLGNPVGDYLLELSAGVADNYTLYADDVTFSVVPLPVDFKGLDVAVDDASKYYTHIDPNFSISNWPQGEGMPLREHFFVSYDREKNAVHDVGSYLIEAKIVPYPQFEDNYILIPGDEAAIPGTLEILPISATLTPITSNKTYGDVDPTLQASVAFDDNYQSSRNYMIDQVAYGVGRDYGENVASYTMFITTANGSSSDIVDIQQANPNYAVSIDDAIDGFGIMPATTMLIANSFTITAGDALPPLTATVHPSYPLRGGDTTLDYRVLTIADGTTEGSYPIEIRLGTNPNYSVLTTGGVLTVNAAEPTTPPNTPVIPLVTPTPTPADPEAAEEVIPNEPAPAAAATVVEEEETPLVASEPIGAWALMNLLCAALSLLLGIFLLVGFLKRNKKIADESKYEYEKMKNIQTDEENERNPKSGRGWRTLSVAIGIISPLVFLLTENIFSPMVLVDMWTLLMAVLLVLQIASIVLLYRARNQEEDHGEEDKSYSMAS